MYPCSSELKVKRKAFASKKSLAESTALADPEVEYAHKGERRGSFFQCMEQQLALNRRHSMSPQTRYVCVYILPIINLSPGLW